MGFGVVGVKALGHWIIAILEQTNLLFRFWTLFVSVRGRGMGLRLTLILLLLAERFLRRSSSDSVHFNGVSEGFVSWLKSDGTKCLTRFKLNFDSSLSFGLGGTSVKVKY